jgi:hypothetical protein
MAICGDSCSKRIACQQQQNEQAVIQGMQPTTVVASRCNSSNMCLPCQEATLEPAERNTHQPASVDTDERLQEAESCQAK